MDTRGVLAGAAVALAVAVSSRESSASTATCGPSISRATVVPCVLAASPAVEAEHRAVEAARGREAGAAVVLPSNPILSLSVGRPLGHTGGALTWSGALAQELEIADQRGARLAGARAAIAAQVKRTALTERESVAAGLVAYFDALAARDELALATRLVQIAEGLAASATVRSEQGLVSPLDADLAYAASVRAVQTRATVERRAGAALAALAVAVGLDPSRAAIRVEGELTPLALHDEDPARLADQALAARLEIEIARAEGAVHQARASLLRRSRVPNPTLSVFAEQDSFNERVIGAGLSFPIPLPAPLGRTHAGEIAEAAALVRRAEADVERVKRQVRLEVLTAAQALASRRKELEAFDPRRLARVEDGLRSLGQELAAGRLTVREALLAQQGLLDLLQAHLEAKRALCIASVELARAAGVAIERGVS